MKRITISLPDELHERLRQEAFRSRVSMAELICLRLEQGDSRNTNRKRWADPLLKTAGVCRGPQLNERIDVDLYGI